MPVTLEGRAFLPSWDGSEPRRWRSRVAPRGPRQLLFVGRFEPFVGRRIDTAPRGPVRRSPSRAELKPFVGRSGPFVDRRMVAAPRGPVTRSPSRAESDPFVGRSEPFVGRRIVTAPRGPVTRSPSWAELNPFVGRSAPFEGPCAAPRGPRREPFVGLRHPPRTTPSRERRPWHPSHHSRRRNRHHRTGALREMGP